jgi:hypothetical protein
MKNLAKLLLLVTISNVGVTCNYKILDQEAETIHSCIWNEDPIDEDFVEESLSFLKTENENTIKNEFLSKENLFFILDSNGTITEKKYIPITNYLDHIYTHSDFDNLDKKQTFKSFFSISKKIYEDKNTPFFKKASILLLSTHVWMKVYDHFIMLRRQQKIFNSSSTILYKEDESVFSSPSESSAVAEEKIQAEKNINSSKKKKWSGRERKSRSLACKRNTVHDKPR